MSSLDTIASNFCVSTDQDLVQNSDSDGHDRVIFISFKSPDDASIVVEPVLEMRQNSNEFRGVIESRSQNDDESMPTINELTSKKIYSITAEKNDADISNDLQLTSLSTKEVHTTYSINNVRGKEKCDQQSQEDKLREQRDDLSQSHAPAFPSSNPESIENNDVVEELYATCASIEKEDTKMKNGELIISFAINPLLSHCSGAQASQDIEVSFADDRNIFDEESYQDPIKETIPKSSSSTLENKNTTSPPQIDSGNPRTEMKNGDAITSCAHSLLSSQPNEKHTPQSFEVPSTDVIHVKNEEPHESKDGTTDRKAHDYIFPNPEVFYSCDEEIGKIHSINHIPASQDALDTHIVSGFEESITKLNSVDQQVNKIIGNNESITKSNSEDQKVNKINDSIIKLHISENQINIKETDEGNNKERNPIQHFPFRNSKVEEQVITKENSGNETRKENKNTNVAIVSKLEKTASEETNEKCAKNSELTKSSTESKLGNSGQESTVDNTEVINASNGFESFAREINQKLQVCNVEYQSFIAKAETLLPKSNENASKIQKLFGCRKDKTEHSVPDEEYTVAGSKTIFFGCRKDEAECSALDEAGSKIENTITPNKNMTPEPGTDQEVRNNIGDHFKHIHSACEETFNRERMKAAKENIDKNVHVIYEKTFSDKNVNKAQEFLKRCAEVTLCVGMELQTSMETGAYYLCLCTDKTLLSIQDGITEIRRNNNVNRNKNIENRNKSKNCREDVKSNLYRVNTKKSNEFIKLFNKYERIKGLKMKNEEKHPLSEDQHVYMTKNHKVDKRAILENKLRCDLIKALEQGEVGIKKSKSKNEKNNGLKNSECCLVETSRKDEFCSKQSRAHEVLNESKCPQNDELIKSEHTISKTFVLSKLGLKHPESVIESRPCQDSMCSILERGKCSKSDKPIKSEHSISKTLVQSKLGLKQPESIIESIPSQDKMCSISERGLVKPLDLDEDIGKQTEAIVKSRLSQEDMSSFPEKLAAKTSVCGKVNLKQSEVMLEVQSFHNDVSKSLENGASKTVEDRKNIVKPPEAINENGRSQNSVSKPSMHEKDKTLDQVGVKLSEIINTCSFSEDGTYKTFEQSSLPEIAGQGEGRVKEIRLRSSQENLSGMSEYGIVGSSQQVDDTKELKTIKNIRGFHDVSQTSLHFTTETIEQGKDGVKQSKAVGDVKPSQHGTSLASLIKGPEVIILSTSSQHDVPENVACKVNKTSEEDDFFKRPEGIIGTRHDNVSRTLQQKIIRISDHGKVGGKEEESLNIPPEQQCTEIQSKPILERKYRSNASKFAEQEEYIGKQQGAKNHGPPLQDKISTVLGNISKTSEQDEESSKEKVEIHRQLPQNSIPRILDCNKAYISLQGTTDLKQLEPLIGRSQDDVSKASGGEDNILSQSGNTMGSSRVVKSLGELNLLETYSLREKQGSTHCHRPLLNSAITLIEQHVKAVSPRFGNSIKESESNDKDTSNTLAYGLDSNTLISGMTENSTDVDDKLSVILSELESLKQVDICSFDIPEATRDMNKMPSEIEEKVIKIISELETVRNFMAKSSIKKDLMLSAPMSKTIQEGYDLKTKRKNNESPDFVPENQLLASLDEIPYKKGSNKMSKDPNLSSQFAKCANKHESRTALEEEGCNLKQIEGDATKNMYISSSNDFGNNLCNVEHITQNNEELQKQKSGKVSSLLKTKVIDTGKKLISDQNKSKMSTTTEDNCVKSESDSNVNELCKNDAKQIGGSSDKKAKLRPESGDKISALLLKESSAFNEFSKQSGIQINKNSLEDTVITKESMIPPIQNVLLRKDVAILKKRSGISTPALAASQSKLDHKKDLKNMPVLKEDSGVHSLPLRKELSFINSESKKVPSLLVKACCSFNESSNQLMLVENNTLQGNGTKLKKNERLKRPLSTRKKTDAKIKLKQTKSQENCQLTTRRIVPQGYSSFSQSTLIKNISCGTNKMKDCKEDYGRNFEKERALIKTNFAQKKAEILNMDSRNPFNME